MTFQVISLSSPNDGSGDPLRDGGFKINSNFLLASETFDTLSADINDNVGSLTNRLNVTSIWTQSLGLTKANSSALNNNVGSLQNLININSADEWNDVGSLTNLITGNTNNINVHSVWISSLQSEILQNSAWIAANSTGGGGGGVAGSYPVVVLVRAVNSLVYPAGNIGIQNGSAFINIGSAWNTTSGYMAMPTSGFFQCNLEIGLNAFSCTTITLTSLPSINLFTGSLGDTLGDNQLRTQVNYGPPNTVNSTNLTTGGQILWRASASGLIPVASGDLVSVILTGGNEVRSFSILGWPYTQFSMFGPL